MSDLDAIKALRDRIVKACAEELQALLDKHGCTLRAVSFIASDGRPDSRIHLTVKEQ